MDDSVGVCLSVFQSVSVFILALSSDPSSRSLTHSLSVPPFHMNSLIKCQNDEEQKQSQ